MKSTELRKSSDAELQDKLDGYRKELFNLRWQTASHQNQNPKRVREVRRSVARILTIMNERKREGSGQ